MPNRLCYLFGGYPAGSAYTLIGMMLCIPPLLRAWRRGLAEVRVFAVGFLVSWLFVVIATCWALFNDNQPGLARALSLVGPIILILVMAQSLSTRHQ